MAGGTLEARRECSPAPKNRGGTQVLRVAIAAPWFAAPAGTEGERVRAMPSLRPPRVARKPRRRLRCGPD
ncbi:hypothetical protein JCGZ_18196 [Jatropha curcas]|uniref:Uncharacterized protein n=1 Tax=Jatropha curcas TaxID=180498 RepID=A0A067K551_JATCU|nr:hypothetical protein JCGZ_18196 [Jatropha curcas]